MRRLGDLLCILICCALSTSHSRAGEAPTRSKPQAGGETTIHLANQHAFGRSLANLPVSRLRDFAYGNRIFNTNWVTSPASVPDFDGLGPLFNRASCTGCHVRDGRGQPVDAPQAIQESAVIRIGRVQGAEAIPHPILGSQIQDRGIHGQPPEARVELTYAETLVQYPDGHQTGLRAPTVTIHPTDPSIAVDDLALSFRVAQPVFGLGLLEAVEDTSITQYADPHDTDGNGVSGRAQRTIDAQGRPGALGRFGWKAGQPSLRMQAASAFAGDIGITSHLFPKDDRTPHQVAAGPQAYDAAPELRPADLQKLEFYLRALAVPARRDMDNPVVIRGETLFHTIGCADCHRSTMQTRADAALPSLASQTIHPYTDLLLHDMGAELADGLPEHQASGREWRTPPLWGIGLTQVVNGHTRFLHDGRARNLEEAILWHGGEALSSKTRFMELPQADRTAVLQFLESL